MALDLQIKNVLFSLACLTSYVAQMIAGTAQVRAALGSDSSKVTTKQIEEALWHYYYDTEKSVAYLASKYIAPKPTQTPAQKKNKAGGRFPHFHLDTLGTGVNKQHAEALAAKRYHPETSGAFGSLFRVDHAFNQE
jgi:elongation factor 1 alpha-like protein